MLLKTLYLIGPDGLINQGYVNSKKMVSKTMVHVPRFRIKHQKFSEIFTVLRPSHDILSGVKYHFSRNLYPMIYNLREVSFPDLEPRDGYNFHADCFQEICIPSVYKSMYIISVLS